jgi:MFS family permease
MSTGSAVEQVGQTVADGVGTPAATGAKKEEPSGVTDAAVSRALWRNADFNKFWGGQSISVLGSEVTLLALPLTAIIMLHAGAAQLGYISAASTVSTLVLTLFAGALADRFRRKPLMIWADIGRAVALGSIPALAFAGLLSLPVLYAVALISGALGVLFGAAEYAYIPSLLGETQLLSGNGRMSASQSAGGIIGASAAGALVSLFRPAFVILGDAVSFVVSAVSLAMIRKLEPKPKRAPVGERENARTVLAEIGQGLKVTFTNRFCVPLALNSIGANFGAMIILTLFILYARHDLHISPLWIGVIYACGGVGGVAGGALTNMAVQRIGFGRATMASMLAYRALCLTPLVRGPKWLEIGALSIIWLFTVLGVVMSNVCQGTLTQYVIPNELLGRQGSASNFVGLGILPLAALAAGYLGAHLGLHSAIVVGALALPLPLLWVIFSPIPRLRRLTDAPKGDSDRSVPASA